MEKINKKNTNHIKKMSNYINYIVRVGVLLTAIVVFNACNECPLVEVPTVYMCESRIVTLEKFNPNYTIQPQPSPQPPLIILDPEYNISVFEFPLNKSATGSFPNDVRFKDHISVPVALLPFIIGNQLYYVAVMDNVPANKDIPGDVLVKDVNVDPLDTYATVRVSGKISRVFQGAPISENAQDFCDLGVNQSAIFEDSFKKMSDDNLYGKNDNRTVIYSYSSSTIKILDFSYNVMGDLGSFGVPNPTLNILSNFQGILKNNPSYDMQFRVGDVYTYVSKNGKRFVLAVTEIRKSGLAPNRSRVTLMFFNVDESIF